MAYLFIYITYPTLKIINMHIPYWNLSFLLDFMAAVLNFYLYLHPIIFIYSTPSLPLSPICLFVHTIISIFQVLVTNMWEHTCYTYLVNNTDLSDHRSCACFKFSGITQIFWLRFHVADLFLEITQFCRIIGCMPDVVFG